MAEDNVIKIKTRGYTIFDVNVNLLVTARSTTDNLAILPWRLLHDGYEVSRQSTVVSVDADAGIPITHSKFTEGGRIISAKIYVDNEPSFWVWYKTATNNRALPCWVYDARVKGFVRCYITEEPSLSPASNSVNGCYVQLKLYAKAQSLEVQRFVTADKDNKYVIEHNDNFVVETEGEVLY